MNRNYEQHLYNKIISRGSDVNDKEYKMQNIIYISVVPGGGNAGEGKGDDIVVGKTTEKGVRTLKTNVLTKTSSICCF